RAARAARRGGVAARILDIPRRSHEQRLFRRNVAEAGSLHTMSRILIAECKQEVSTFNPHLSGYDDFAIRRGEEILGYHRTVRNEVGGALHVFASRAGVQLVPTY